jgi:hypothetical protein
LDDYQRSPQFNPAGYKFLIVINDLQALPEIFSDLWQGNSRLCGLNPYYDP